MERTIHHLVNSKVSTRQIWTVRRSVLDLFSSHRAQSCKERGCSQRVGGGGGEVKLQSFLLVSQTLRVNLAFALQTWRQAFELRLQSLKLLFVWNVTGDSFQTESAGKEQLYERCV